MSKPPDAVAHVLGRLRALRERAGLTPADLDSSLILGPGWVDRFEDGSAPLPLDVLFVILDTLNASPSDLFRGSDDDVPDLRPAEMVRAMRAEQVADDLLVYFPYGAHDAVYRLAGGTLAQLEAVLQSLRDGLARLTTAREDREEQVKTSAVTSAFESALAQWPAVNPSDLWWFVVYRAFLDPYNHPAAYARLSFDQSWKRTGGWALESIVVRHFKPALERHGIGIELPSGARKQQLVGQLLLDARVEADKADVVLVGPGDVCFGVVHVKSSFAERRTDDVPLSHALVRAGYCSPLVTMDCKSTPGVAPVNRGELGPATGRRSAKRRDIEDDGLFSACFSFNTNTAPTPASATGPARIFRSTFQDPDDDPFTRHVRNAWARFQANRRS